MQNQESNNEDKFSLILQKNDQTHFVMVRDTVISLLDYSIAIAEEAVLSANQSGQFVLKVGAEESLKPLAEKFLSLKINVAIHKIKDKL